MKRYILLYLLLLVLALAVLFGGRAIADAAVSEPFVADPSLAMTESEQHTVVRYQAALRERGVDVSIPCIPEGGVKVTVPGVRIKYTSAGVHYQLRRGTEVTTDFFTTRPKLRASNNRCIDLNIPNQHDATMRMSDILTLYCSYIKENQLQAQFEQESGMPFSTANAKKALLDADRQCYQMGITDDVWYPYNRPHVGSLLWVLALLTPLLLVFILIIINRLKERHRTSQFWKKWNIESQARVDKTQLPEFHSLRDKWKD